MNIKRQFQGFPQANNVPLQPFDNVAFKGLCTFSRLLTIKAANAGGNQLTISDVTGNSLRFNVNTGGSAASIAFLGTLTLNINASFDSNGIPTFASASGNLLNAAQGNTGTINAGGNYSIPNGGVLSQIRVGLAGGSTGATPATGNNYASVIIANGGVTEAGSGTHPLLANLVVRALTLTNGAGATTNTASVYIEDAPTGITPTGENYAVWSDAGINRFDGVLELGVSVSAAGTLTLDNTANTWIANGTTTTWTLPAISGKTGWTYHLKNKGSGAITLNSNAGGNDIYNTSAVNTISIAAGQGCMLVNDGTNWTVISLA